MTRGGSDVVQIIRRQASPTGLSWGHRGCDAGLLLQRAMHDGGRAAWPGETLPKRGTGELERVLSEKLTSPCETGRFCSTGGGEQRAGSLRRSRLFELQAMAAMREANSIQGEAGDHGWLPKAGLCLARDSDSWSQGSHGTRRDAQVCFHRHESRASRDGGSRPNATMSAFANTCSWPSQTFVFSCVCGNVLKCRAYTTKRSGPIKAQLQENCMAQITGQEHARAGIGVWA